MEISQKMNRRYYKVEAGIKLFGINDFAYGIRWVHDYCPCYIFYDAHLLGCLQARTDKRMWVGREGGGEKRENEVAGGRGYRNRIYCAYKRVQDKYVGCSRPAWGLS